MKLRDKVVLGKRTVDNNGFVSVPVAITKVGIQQYHSSELISDKTLANALKGKTGLINVFRSEDTVFHPLTIESFKNIPVTIQHPDSFVSPKDAKFVVSGHVGEDVDRLDDERLGATAHLYDKDAIDISFGSEISAGYECPIVPKSGTYNGVKYDFAFDGAMIANHLALVPAGRCGSGVGVLDKQTEDSEVKDEDVKKIVSDETAKLKDEIEKLVKDSIASMSSNVESIVSQKINDEIKKIDDAKKEADEEAKKKADEEAKEKADAKKVALEVDTRATLKNLLEDKYDSEKDYMDQAREFLKDSVDDVDKKSDEYILDKLADEVKARKDAEKSLAPRKDSSYSSISIKAFQ